MFDPVSYHVAETLNDRREVEIRAQRPEDREALLFAISRASKETLYHRFLVAKRNFSEEEEHFFLDIDFINHVVLVAETIEDGRPVIIGGCRYIVVEPGRAEVAFSVIDAYQKKGLGTALMRRLAAVGREAGLTEFFAEVLSDNVPMMKVFKRSGLAMTTKLEGPVFSVSLNLPRPGKPHSQAPSPKPSPARISTGVVSARKRAATGP
jgi:RimJ/RimL family protein N-acetyltransferase